MSGLKLIGLGAALAILVLVAGTGGRFGQAQAPPADPPLQNVHDAQGRYIIPQGGPIPSDLLDGEFGREWDDANLLTSMPFHDVDDESITFPTRILVKHDGENLYFAVEIEQRQSWNDFWAFIMLDKDGDRSVLTDGDDYLQVPAKGQTIPQPRDLHRDAQAQQFVPDVNKGGTNDIQAAGREFPLDDAFLFHIEGQHPLNSGDRWDVAWQAGETVGLLFGTVGLGSGLTTKTGDPRAVSSFLLAPMAWQVPVVAGDRVTITKTPQSGGQLRVKGTVTTGDDPGTPVEGADVLVWEEGDSNNRATDKTDENGQFTVTLKANEVNGREAPERICYSIQWDDATGATHVITGCEDP